MTTRISIVLLAAALLPCLQLQAQNINQSVEVTNDYVSRFSDFQKQGTSLQVPDSLYVFDYDFDYTVFETPYKGSYDFSPYRIQVTPMPRPYDGSRMLLRAGAGYTLHPVLDFAWQPVVEKDRSVSVFAGINGYGGNYHRNSAALPLTSGYDISTQLGVALLNIRPRVRLSGRLAYEGMFQGSGEVDGDQNFGLHSILAEGRVVSRDRAENHLSFDLGAKYRHSGDASFLKGASGREVEDNVRVSLSAGPILQQKYSILLDADFQLNVMNMSLGTILASKQFATLASLRPHVDFLLGPVHLDAGVRMDYSGSAVGDQFTLVPDVVARLSLLGAKMELFAAITGGQHINTLYEFRQLNHFACMPMAAGSVSQEGLHLRAGLEGHLDSRLQYALEVGALSARNTPLASFRDVCTTDYSAFYGRAFASWKTERTELDGTLSYTHIRRYVAVEAWTPAPLTADLRFRYNWRRRIYAGAFLEAASLRKWLGTADMADIAGYANLGLTGEWRFDSRWSVWAEAGNLLGMAVERMPGYIEKGPYLTVGLGFKL